MGAKAGKKGASRGRSDKSAGRQRLALIVFAALLVLLFVGFAVAQGIGSPSVPDGDVAMVESVPDDVGQISEKDLDRAVEQQVAEAKLKKTPEPGSDKYLELRDAALGEILERTWIFGQAENSTSASPTNRSKTNSRRSKNRTSGPKRPTRNSSKNRNSPRRT